MKTIPLDMIEPGTVAAFEYYSPKGELLIAKGAQITVRHLELLRRRNMLELCTQTTEDEEIRSILRKEITDLGELDLVESERRQGVAPVEVKPGKEGLAQLNESKVAENLDVQMSSGAAGDKPVGPALREDARQIDVLERSAEYKEEVADSYQEALAVATRSLDSLARGERVGGKELWRIAERFVKIFLNDRNILINMSGTKNASGDYIYTHSLNVCLLSINVAAAYGYSRNQVVEIGIGALVHDVGMLLIPRSIRFEEGRLSDEQWYEIQKHPILGLHLLEKVRGLPISVPFVAYQTHERCNGRGYPKQRHSVLIHRYAKVVQVADVYEAMTSERPHREPQIPYKAMASILKMARQGLISEEFVKAFLEYASLFPVGSLVQLSDNRIAKVVGANGTSYAKPVVSVLTDTSGKLLDRKQVYQVDLKRETGCGITKALPSDFLRSVRIMDGF